MTAHQTGKWGRGEGMYAESTAKKKGKPKGYASYMTSNKRPYGVQCWCYRCAQVGRDPYHRWEDPCAGSQVVDGSAA